ncbi:MAG: ABC-type polysaccharide/polyol phosphate export permease [Desulforhopalus sp.]|jgi:ABC-type polysaccharide/polyol phosphate export permease
MLNSLVKFVKLLVEQRFLVVALAKREISAQYVGSLLGVLWTFIQPLVLIFVFWFVFSIGFKVKPMNDVPFVVWLTAGMAPWFLFAQIITSSTGAVIQHANLVKKTVFHSEILPIVNIASGIITHLVFLFLIIILLFFHQLSFSFYIVQTAYYLFCLCVLSLSLGWIFSALNVFLRDVGQIVGVMIQVGFWATPIFWDIKMMSPQVQSILKLNPVFYIVQGYRDSFIYHQGFWLSPYWTLYFWSVTLFLLVAGITIFQRLKPQFADVL